MDSFSLLPFFLDKRERENVATNRDGVISLATYKQIQEYIYNTHKINVKTCYIADAKDKFNLPLKRSSRQRKYSCPAEVLKYIEDAFHHFKMI